MEGRTVGQEQTAVQQPMQHLIIFFEHKLQDLILWSEFIQRVRPLLADHHKGEFAGDDMAIDGGDCEAVFRGPDADALFDFLRPQLLSLPFLNTASTRVELVYGELESSAATKTLELNDFSG